MGGATGKPHEVKQFLRTAAQLSPAAAGNHTWYHDIFQRGELRQKLVELKDKADVLVAETRQSLTPQAEHVRPADGERAAVGLPERPHYL